MIVTASRQYGSEGETIARSVAETLGLAVVDRDVVYAAALKAGIPADILQRLMYTRERHMAGDIIQGLGSITPAVAASAAANPLLGIFSPLISTDVVSLEETVRAIGEAIKSLAVRGNVLILGQGSQALFEGQPGVCRVLFVAPFEVRVANVAEWHKLSPGEARRRVRGRDEARRDYLARYHNIRWLDPLLYDLVINTAHMTHEDAAAILLRAVQGAASRAPGEQPAIS